MAEALATITRVTGLAMIAIRADLDRAGDAIAAMFFVHYLRSGRSAEALARAGSAIFGVLAKTAEAGAREIQIIAAQDEIVNPSRLFEVQDLGA